VSLLLENINNLDKYLDYFFTVIILFKILDKKFLGKSFFIVKKK